MLLACMASAGCSPITEQHHETSLAWKTEPRVVRAPDSDRLHAAAVRDGNNVRVRITRVEACASGTREWVYVRDRTERSASLPILLLEGALVAGGAGLTIVAARKAGEDPGTLDSSSNRVAGVAAGAGGVLTALAATALTFDLLSARDSVSYGVRRGRPDQLQTQPCRTRPANESLVTLTLGDGTAVEGITDEAGEVLLAVPAGLPHEAFDLASVAVDGQPWGSLSVLPAPCR
jgi:hypothetical protein